MVFLCRSANVTNFLDKIRRYAGMPLLTSLVGVAKSFYHHWKGLLNLHGKSLLKISFLTDLLLSEAEFHWSFAMDWHCAGMPLLTSLVGVAKSFYHHWNDLLNLHGKTLLETSFLTDLLLSDVEFSWSFKSMRTSNKFCFGQEEIVEKGDSQQTFSMRIEQHSFFFSPCTERISPWRLWKILKERK